MKTGILNLLSLHLPDSQAEKFLRSSMAEPLGPQALRELVLEGGFLDRRARMRELYTEDCQKGYRNPFYRYAEFVRTGSFNAARRLWFPRRDHVPELYGSFTTPYSPNIPPDHLDLADTSKAVYLASSRTACTVYGPQGEEYWPAVVQIRRFPILAEIPAHVDSRSARGFTEEGEIPNTAEFDEEALTVAADLLTLFSRGTVSKDNFDEALGMVSQRGFVWNIGTDGGPNAYFYGIGRLSAFERIKDDVLDTGSSKKSLHGLGVSVLENGSKTLDFFEGNPSRVLTHPCLDLPPEKGDLLILKAFLDRVGRKAKVQKLFPQNEAVGVDIN